MPFSRRRVLGCLWFASLLALVSACGSTHCTPAGECIAVPSDVPFYLRWVLVLALSGVATLLFAFALDGLNTVTLGALGLVTTIGVFFVHPGCTRPSVAGSHLYRPSAHAASTPRPAATSPQVEPDGAREPRAELDIHQSKPKVTESPGESLRTQLGLTRNALGRLRSSLTVRIEPLVDRYELELDGYLEQLREELPKTGATSHAELLAHSDEHRATVHKLARAALLRSSLQWLKAKRQATSAAIAELEQAEFRLSHQLELNHVGATIDVAGIRPVLDSATRLLDEVTTPPEKQDNAAMEAELFRLLRGADT
ncbi:MAG: hypothetical protein FJ096_21165 [Deltaproteobacteria bacterium]|nr:hypothetical protein [Deltaproteobacteria bacterium]